GCSTPAGLARQVRPRTKRSVGGGSPLAPRKANARALNPIRKFLLDTLCGIHFFSGFERKVTGP
ncbi:MAG: hypothetical protein RR651_05750, partial [Lysinibacillus sp.]